MNKTRVGIYVYPEQLKKIKKNAIDEGVSMSDFLVRSGTVGYQPKKYDKLTDASTAGAAIK